MEWRKKMYDYKTIMEPLQRIHMTFVGIEKLPNPKNGDIVADSLTNSTYIFDGIDWQKLGTVNNLSQPEPVRNFKIRNNCSCCGAPLPNINKDICTCEYCGSIQQIKIY